MKKYMQEHYLAGTANEGCGHQHKTAQAAIPCAKKMCRYGRHAKVWRIWYEGKRRHWEEV